MNAIHIVVAVFLNSLWIDALLALAVWALLRSVRVNASTRYFGWLVTLIAAIVLPVLTTIPQISYAHRTAQPVMSAVQTSAVYHRAAVTHAARTLHSAKAQPPSAQQRAAQPPPSGAAPTTAAPSIRLPGRLHFTMPVWLAQGLFVLWALFALFIGVRLAWDLYRLERLKREAMPLPFELRDQMERWVEAAYGAARPVRICVSDKIEVPVAVGLFDSMILLPAHLLEQLSAGEIDRISLHELAHLRRADDWTNSVQRIAQIVFFFNPAIKFIGSQLDLEREVACDDWVLALTGEIRPYATCLHKMAELTAWPHQALAAPGVFATRKGISVRIERLLNRHRNARVNVGYLVPTGVIAALVALFVFANVVTPVIAYTPEGAIITKPPAVSQVLAHAKKLVAHVPIVAWPIIRTVQPAPRASVRTVVHTEYKTRTVYLRNVNKTSNGHAVNTPPRLRALPAVRLPPNVAAVAQVPPVDVNVPPTHVYVPPTHVHVPAVHPYVGPINVNVPEVKVDVPAIHVHVPSVRRCACAADEQVARGNGPSCSGCDLENVDWSGRDLSGRNFAGSNFSHARLASANFNRANLSGIDFDGADLRNANFTGANLTGCNLQNANIAGARFEGANISGCDGVNPQSLDQAQLRTWLSQCSGCDFARADFRNMNLRGMNISGVSFAHADFRGADLSYASFTGADFSRAMLAGARVYRTRFSGCDFSRTDLRNVDLNQAELTGSDLSSAIMR